MVILIVFILVIGSISSLITFFAVRHVSHEVIKRFTIYLDQREDVHDHKDRLLRRELNKKLSKMDKRIDSIADAVDQMPDKVEHYFKKKGYI